MILLYLSFLCIFIIFAHLTDSKVIILRDYDDEPLYIDETDTTSEKEVPPKQQAFSAGETCNEKQNLARKTKQAVLHYGRHIYHLDSFEDMTKLRTKMPKSNQDSYDYVDVNDLVQSNDAGRSIPVDNLQDLVFLSQKPFKVNCEGKDCDEDLRKFSKIQSKDDIIWMYKKMPLGNLKRFQIVNNRKKQKPVKKIKPKKKYVSSEESREKRNSKSNKKKKKKKKHSSESDSDSKESKDSSNSNESWNSKRLSESNSKSSEESTEYSTKKTKKMKESTSDSYSAEKWDSSESKSDEDYSKKKKKKYHDSSEETNRKTFDMDDDLFLQGNKLYHANSAKKKKKIKDVDRRRRIQQFLPKRYHWSPSQIHDLGYFWFNGPRGRYPGPTTLLHERK